MEKFAPAQHLQPFASYACLPDRSHGRLHNESEDPARSPYQRDRDRIIHSAAFRRLEYKTQVFVNHEGDHYRTRLTHSLEVSQLARTISRSLGLNEDLAEALALAHDLGHTPFGHAGEDALQEAMEGFGGFDHNAQTLRILTKLEHRYAEFDGLNLTWETLEGIAKHNGPVSVAPRAMKEYLKEQDLEIHTYASAEAQVAALSDDIAYNNHDIDDGLRSKLFSIDEIRSIPFVDSAFSEVEKKYKGIEEYRLVHESIRRMVSRMANDLLKQTGENIRTHHIQTVSDIRALGKPLVAFSPDMEKHIQALKSFLMQNMYRHYKVNRMTSKAKRIVKELFSFFLHEPNCLPLEWQKKGDAPNTQKTAIAVADFIAGMTDRFAMEEHIRLFDMKEKS
jgi:dGTPase